MRIRFNQISKINNKALLAIITVGLLGITGLLLTMPRPKLIATVSSHPLTLTGKVKSASTGDPADDGTTIVTTTTTTPARSSTNTTTQALANGNILTAASTTTPSAPADPQTPPADPTAGCKVSGRVVVPQGGDSCSFSISIPDSGSLQWYLPAFYSFADGTAAEKPLAPVYVVIESQSETASNQPFMASSITFHFATLAGAPVGDYVDSSDGLKFALVGFDSQPLWIPNQPQLTVVAQ